MWDLVIKASLKEGSSSWTSKSSFEYKLKVWSVIFALILSSSLGGKLIFILSFLLLHFDNQSYFDHWPLHLDDTKCNKMRKERHQSKAHEPTGNLMHVWSAKSALAPYYRSILKKNNSFFLKYQLKSPFFVFPELKIFYKTMRDFGNFWGRTDEKWKQNYFNKHYEFHEKVFNNYFQQKSF